MVTDQAFEEAWDRGLSLWFDAAVDEALHLVDEAEDSGKQVLLGRP